MQKYLYHLSKLGRRIRILIQLQRHSWHWCLPFLGFCWSKMLCSGGISHLGIAYPGDWPKVHRAQFDQHRILPFDFFLGRCVRGRSWSILCVMVPLSFFTIFFSTRSQLMMSRNKQRLFGNSEVVWTARYTPDNLCLLALSTSFTIIALTSFMVLSSLEMFLYLPHEP